MNETSQATSVTILGEEYWIRGGSPEAVRGLAAFVDGRFRELQGARPAMDLKRLAVMVCLNLAEELHEQRSRQAGRLREATEKARTCRLTLDDALTGDASGTAWT